mgnify:CR=1 FL=1
MKLRSFCAWAAVAACLLLPASLQAEVKLPAIFGDHMVLQREMPIPVWGWDKPGTEVTVTLGDTSAKATAGEDGRWMVKLPAQKAGGPHTVKVSGSSDVTFNDVLIGEVWLCSGQSNMEWTVARSANAQEEIANGNHPRIRHIKIPHVPADKPQQDVKAGPWQAATPETVGNFTAVGYYFARELQKELDVPIGLIGSNWGGTRIEPWTPPQGFQAVPALKDIAANLDKYPARNAEGKINHQSPLALYNGMIAPLVPYGIRGALWYQGESNNGEGMLYYEKMKALIAGWRDLWQRPDLPFYFVQLAPYTYGGDPERLPGIWEAQTAALSIPNTGMAVTVDIGNIKDIHPTNKQDVGKRLALWALTKTYGKQGLVYSGPLYKSVTFEGSKARLQFDHVGSGLVSRDGKPLTWFQIAGKDGKFVDATATIDGDTVVVESPEVKEPTAVRFAWHQTAEPNLSNREGLPASPFRTDK